VEESVARSGNDFNSQFNGLLPKSRFSYSLTRGAGHVTFSDRPFRSGKTKKTFAYFAALLAPFNSRSEECNAFNWGPDQQSTIETSSILYKVMHAVHERPQRHSGESFTAENLAVKRPGTGISPMRWDEVIGQVAQKDYEEDELI
jgi:hypothetical protein